MSYLCIDMKQSVFHIILSLLSLSLAAGCTSSRIVPLEMDGPDGRMVLTASYYPNPSDVPGCFGVISHTDGRDVFSSMWLDFYANDNVNPGEELHFENLTFGAPLSSDSRNYANSYTGRMILKEKTRDRVVIRMEDVHFSILHGEYTLNGDLVATVKDSEGGD